MNILISTEEMLKMKSMEQIPMNCPLCKTDFTRLQKQVKSNLKYNPSQKFYCGPVCSRIATRKAKVKLKCFKCDKDFELTQSDYKRKLKKNQISAEKLCCSHTCANQINTYRSQEAKQKISNSLRLYHNSPAIDDKELLLSYIKRNLTRKEIAVEMKISLSTLNKYCAKYKIKSKSREFKGAFQENNINYKICKCCGIKKELNKENFFMRDDGYFGHCRICHTKNSAERFREYKRQCLEYLGGECIRCGYSDCPDALDFHHLDPSQKEFTIANSNLSFETLIPELNKCIVLCATHHREFHAGLFNITMKIDDNLVL